MNPIYLTQRLKRALTQYLLTTYDVNRDGQNAELRSAMREAFEAENALFAGPFLELSLPYERGRSIDELIYDGVLSPKMRTLKKPPIPFDAPLYVHQERAVERVMQGRSIIVSSGTGSGKTEAFLIPILNDLLLDSRPGVRAVLIYPLNALVNDQLDRLRKLLDGTAITFGRYTSELAQTDKEAQKQLGAEWDRISRTGEITSREQIRKGKLPQILITNYAMLEYLMLRPEDSPLFAYPDVWKFIVLDEAHSYSGAKGIEVAYLVRRLKHRLEKGMGEMCCIGTSATLTDDPQSAIKFAETLFGETFTEDDIIFGKEQPLDAKEIEQVHAPPIEAYLMDDVQDLLKMLHDGNEPPVDELRQMLCDDSLVENIGLAEGSSVPEVLYNALKGNRHLIDLRNEMIRQRDLPLAVETAAQKVFAPYDRHNEISADSRLLALDHLIELAGYARTPGNELPLLPTRYHVFARSPQGLWICMNPECAGRPVDHKQPWSRLFSAPRLTCDMCGAAVYPLVVCRTCGQVYIKTSYQDGHYQTEQYDKRENAIQPEVRYFVWSPSEENTALVDEEAEDDTNSNEVNGAKGDYPTASNTPIQLCLNDDCRRDSRCNCVQPRKVLLYPIEKKHTGVGKTRTVWDHELQQCARCRGQSRINTESIATPITTSGSTPLSVLTMELYRRLPESSDEDARSKPGAGRKLLSFYDSRQGAAQYAAFLQDVYNQDLYRYLVPKAIRTIETGTVDLSDVAKKCAEIGWRDLQVFQNALDEDFDALYTNKVVLFNRTWEHLSSSELKRIIERVTVRILAEITVSRKRRQSLESLGLLTVRYFETPPDVTTLAEALHMTETQTRNLIDYLLDTLRDEKAITFPQNIRPDDLIFGKNKWNPTVVRGNAGTGETPWIATERHRRSRIVSMALRAADQPNDFENVQRALGLVWEWLINHKDALVEVGNGRYQLAHDRLFFATPEDDWKRCNRCQRIRHGAIELPCAAPHCGGRYRSIQRSTLEEENYYFSVLTQNLTPMRVEEHTAQLSPERGREYQNQFKRGEINILSCSTTFEMGIDLGDLQAVVMNNVPPNVSNYRQRAGRTGRRAGGTAFIVTWSSDRPHDQVYFSNPPEMIRGHVRVPRLLLNNREIRRRHMNAVLLADFLRYLAKNGRTDFGTVGAFFDPQAALQPHYNFFEEWRQLRRQSLEDMLSQYAILLGEAAFNSESEIASFHHELEKAKIRYDVSSEYYRREIEAAVLQYASGLNRDAADERRKQFEQLLKRLNTDALIDTLSDKGVLPSYSFPLYTVELELPYQLQGHDNLRLQRDLRQAISEYAPGSEVVADKKLWVSGGVRILREAPLIYNYRLCPTCNYLNGGNTAGEAPVLDQDCPVCKSPYPTKNLNARFLVPDGFRTTSDSGKSAGQYVRREPKRESIAVMFPQTTTSSADVSIDWVNLKYKQDGHLYYLNEGRLGMGYMLCLKCGAHITNRKTQKCPTPGCTGNVQQVNLGHEVPTDTLSIQFDPPPSLIPLPHKKDLEFWYTLQTALVLGATYALQIERGDIGGTLFPLDLGTDWQQSLVLYDNVPGGAGYMRDIQRNFGKVVEAALKIVRCGSCSEETSCTHCLRDYNNQAYYAYLKRGRVIKFLEMLHILMSETSDSSGASTLVANNPTHVLMEALANARQSLRLAVTTVRDDIPVGERHSWLDVLHDRLRAGIKVELLLTQPPIPTRNDYEALKTADYLRVMMSTGEGLRICHIDNLPEWHVLIDGDASDYTRAFQFSDALPILDEFSVQPKLRTTTHTTGIAAALQQFEAAKHAGKPVTQLQMQPPPNTRVYRIPSSGLKREEGQIPAIKDFFAAPVVEMRVIDPYLIDHERIVNRLGAYIRLAQSGKELQRVVVETRDANTVLNGDRNDQNRAFETLKHHFDSITIESKRNPSRDLHDRWIEATRADGSKATMYIGRGLDFIRPDGTVQSTYIVIDESLPVWRPLV
jgi:superfamily II DNA or RNA helicase